MKRIIPLLMVISLLISGLSSCKSEPVTVPTCDELIAAYEAAGYHVFHQTESNPENCNCSVKVWADDENDYVFFCFFDSAENAENYDSTREYNVLIYLFSVIYGDPTWIHTETYGNIEYEYSSSALLKPFRDLIQSSVDKSRGEIEFIQMRPFNRRLPMKKYLLPRSGNFYKANLHCHSTVSDGALTPQELKELYTANGYSVIAYTDHDVMIPHHDLTDENFLALTGYEMEVNEARPAGAPYAKTCHFCLIALSPDTKRQICWHREKYLFGNAHNYRQQVEFDEALPDYERSYTHACISDMMQKGRDAGFFVTYNHPAWSMEEYPDYIGYNGMHAMEICNWGCYDLGYEDYVPGIYDTLLRAGKRIFCIATDDNHNRDDDSCGAFTVIKAEKLDYRSITDALMQGHFYASQGPTIEKLWLEENRVHIKCSPATKIFLNTGVRRTAFARAKEGELLTEATFRVYPEDVYFRLTVINAAGQPANTNAYFAEEWL